MFFICLDTISLGFFFLVWRNNSDIWDLLEFSIKETCGCDSVDVINRQKSDELDISKADRTIYCLSCVVQECMFNR